MTTLPTITLTDFLLARIEEDETLGRPRQLAGDEWHAVSCAVNDDTFGGSCDCDVPSRWLAECEAKRRLIHWYGDGEDIGDGGEFLRLLALPHADHPDYQQEWAL